jgi:hypothetical protein
MTRKLFWLILAILVVALPSVSQAKKARTETGEYNTIKADTDPSGPTAKGHLSNGVTFTPRKGERFVSVVLTDKSGLPTRAVIQQDFDGDGVSDVSTEMCGATDAPVAFRKGLDVVVLTQEGPCEDGTGATSTFGTVTATFTR